MVARDPTEAPGAFLFFGVFSHHKALLADVRQSVERRFGPLHRLGISSEYPFPQTRTYAREMGSPLVRQFFVLRELQRQDCLADVKHETIAMEQSICASGCFDVPRPVNIDPGLLNDCRLILASTKDYAHRIYRGRGIWEEITLIYRHGRFDTLPWTYPDFRAPTYHAFFAELRAALLAAIRANKAQPGQQP